VTTMPIAKQTTTIHAWLGSPGIGERRYPLADRPQGAA
jgi:hypothetical protein